VTPKSAPGPPARCWALDARSPPRSPTSCPRTRAGRKRPRGRQGTPTRPASRGC